MSKKKQTEEEKIIADAADIIMRTIHTAATRIAEKYERQLMDEVVTRITIMKEAQDTVKDGVGNFISKKIDELG